MFMDMRRSILSLLAVVFLASSLLIMYYLLDSGFYTNSDLFWIGGLSGVFGCIFFVIVCVSEKKICVSEPLLST
jgi:hypothetical protein